MKLHKIFFALLLGLLFFSLASQTPAQAPSNTGFFIRFKVTAPTAGEKFQVNIGGFLHNGEPWVLPNLQVAADKEKWTEWINLSDWKWHGKLNRAGGIAEWNSLRLTILGNGGAASSFAVELSDLPNPAKPLIAFTEQSESNGIGFLAPFPLRENAKEFETGSQMTARHAKWAMEATSGKPVILKKFDLITQLWGHYDPSLERQEISSLKQLGFNVLGGITPGNARKAAIRVYGHSSNYSADPDYVNTEWKNLIGNQDMTSEDGKWRYQTMPHWVISDEVSGVDFRAADPAKANVWFREYLKNKGVTAADLGKPIESVEFPLKMMSEPFFPKSETLLNRKILYYAAKFNQWWSAQRLRQATDLIHGTFPNIKSETLIPSHGFLGNAWGPANIGMSYRMLDIFELGAQESLQQISAEDWLGLNHMYWTDYTWTGGQTFGYFNAIARSGIGDKPIMLRGLITPSDNDYLQLKAHSSLGQGAKSFFFWTFGPTYIGTENYWSDLKSEYDGIARLGRTLEKSEDVISETKPVTDQVGIIYSVSHDIWNTDNHTAFVEKRLLWHALKHLQIQPDFVREEDVIAGKLAKYKAVYLTDWLISRKASEAIDKWVKAGGVLYLSAGAATRDEFSEPYSPPFAEAVWGKNAAQNFVSEKHAYNERTDLPKIKPLTTVRLNINQKSFDLPAIGARLNLAPNPNSFATFADSKTAGAELAYGQGKIIAVGFMPMLAYGASAEFKPTTLEEKWMPEPREIIKKVLDAAKITPAIESNVPVVEADLLAGENGSAVVLANYTYQPIETLTIDIKTTKAFKQATSTEGSHVQMSKLPDGRIRLTLPLKWTDIILLK